MAPGESHAGTTGEEGKLERRDTSYICMDRIANLNLGNGYSEGRDWALAVQMWQTAFQMRSGRVMERGR